MNTQPSQRPGRGRRPAAELRSTILAATWLLFRHEGIGAVTFEKVAALAPCSKVTLYKWWASPGTLAAEAFFTATEPMLTLTDTGDLEHDLCAQLSHWVDLLNKPDIGPAVAGLIGAAQSDPDLAHAWSENYSQARRKMAVDRLERAVAAGQIRAGLDLQVAVDQLWGACYHRLLIPDEPLTQEFAVALVRNLLHGIGRADGL